MYATISTRFHNIEVEDTVHALLEYDGVRIGLYRATTSEPRGTEYLSLVGDQGRIVWDKDGARLGRHEPSIREHIMRTRHEDRRKHPLAIHWEEVEAQKTNGPSGISLVMYRFLGAIRRGDSLIATGEDGRNELELANAMHLSGLRKKRVTLPVNRAEVDQLYAELRSGALKVPASA